MASHKFLALFFGLLSITTLTFAAVDEYRCDHDDHDYEIEKWDVAEDMSSLQGGRLLRSEDYPNMRVAGNYEPLSSAPSNFEAYVRDQLAPPVLAFISGALRVKYPVDGLLRVSSSKVCDVRTPDDLREGIAADYYIIFDSRDEDSNTVASSRACSSASGTGRPLTAYSNINRQMLKVASEDDVVLHEKNMYLVIHEIFHTLGISKNAYGDYIDDNGDQLRNHIKTVSYGGVSQTVIDVQPLTERLRNFYGCPSLQGAIMENDGGSGTAKSHMERKFFVYEVISSGGIFGRRVSEFSLALLEGSGWYKPNYNYAEPFFFGKGQGCDFITEKCSSSRSIFDEFCTGSSRGCAPQGRSGGKCSSDSKANGCRYIDPDQDWDCDNDDAIDNARLPDLETYGRGQNAKCFTGSLNTRKSGNGATSFCFKYQCVGSGSDAQVQVLLKGGNSVTCTEKGQVSVDGYYGTIDCPDPLTFCNTVGVEYCPRNCMNRGQCINNVCQCEPGYKGVDCGLNA